MAHSKGVSGASVRNIHQHALYNKGQEVHAPHAAGLGGGVQGIGVQTDTPTPEQRPYKPRGSALNLLYAKDPEVIMVGPAGTGKSRANLEKMNIVASKYANARLLMVRKTLKSLRQSAMVTFENAVLPQDTPVYFHGGDYEYRYPNGSVLVCGGMDKASKIMSTDYDVIYVMEATELTEDDWEQLTTRCRYGKVPYQQVIADCNPDSPYHWLKRRIDKGMTLGLTSLHHDNPILWDDIKQEWTERGKAYMTILDRLTGVRKQRLRFGQWAAAEGMVYDAWDRAVNLIDRFPVPRNWQRFLSIDFGYTHPFVCQWWAMDPDGRLYMYRELYGTGKLVEDWARLIKHIHAQAEDPPAKVITDHDAEDRATLERHLGVDTIPAVKSVSAGIQAVNARLRKAGDGKARLYIVRDALVQSNLFQRDQELDARKLPASTIEEIEGYVWAKNRDGSWRKDQPVKEGDHGMDAMRYCVATVDGVDVSEGVGQDAVEQFRQMVNSRGY